MVHPVNLHDTPPVFMELIQAAAVHFSIPEAYVEKDYWVTKVLCRLSASPFAGSLVFKGGTSLSKAHRLIRRFSEDIDLSARCHDLTGNRTKQLLRRAEKAITVDLKSQRDPIRESKGTQFRKSVYAYPGVINKGDMRFASDTILLEINAFTVPEPSERLLVSSFIGELLTLESRTDLLERYELTDFELDVLRVERTLCEKVMALVRASYANELRSSLRPQIRHIYDLCMILRRPRYWTFVATEDFGAMMRTVRDSDRVLFDEAERWLARPASEAPIFADASGVWPTLKPGYREELRQIVYDQDLPEDQEVLNTLGHLHHHV
ncbi:MAG: nucleotidyl transferase AbiEii/AbiGii toxin family protein [Gammaproteobacteria bacterium]|nr:nucleotidyl transferase AbiEii/AbiGii toxin family protein [Gammaproteobacteria bacterium]MDE0364170.1 nucleotidyl transferase AbiEii/AbiGii toxin family protein [Gammaproteobacteria bacterium]